ncbi:MAG: nicotinamide riboside transporter PnuC [Arthrobacter sp.]|uniref:nicotinamide riboside transporter PnuC n=1 Tax=Arthrobacter sp. TaxID=1667 RepID=UPI003473D78E
MEPMRWMVDASKDRLPGGGGQLLVREIVGNLFGLASALGGMRRRLWARPVGIVGNLILLTVFIGSVFDSAQAATLWGQAGRRLMFIAVSIYGWHRWLGGRRGAGAAITPRWAAGTERIGLVAVLLIGTLAVTPVFRHLGSAEPVWADAGTFVGSLVATFGMAEGWVDFWLVWVAMDVAEVPLLLSAGSYASAVMYLFYGLFTVAGFFVWWRAGAAASAAASALGRSAGIPCASPVGRVGGPR